ncbi:hypothetical protein CPC08DRAFT_756361 [Agrocybe pediades]|nr:hypothetical protein CPC08DRAFT_756361 [Agrocybe pediades]
MTVEFPPINGSLVNSPRKLGSWRTGVLKTRRILQRVTLESSASILEEGPIFVCLRIAFIGTQDWMSRSVSKPRKIVLCPSQDGVRPPSASQFLFSVPEYATKYTRTRSEASPGSDTAMQVDDTDPTRGGSAGAAAHAAPLSQPHTQQLQHPTHVSIPPISHPHPAHALPEAAVASDPSTHPPQNPPAVYDQQHAIVPPPHIANPPAPTPQQQPQPSARGTPRPTFKVGEQFTLAPAPEGGWKRPAGMSSELLVLHTKPESRRIQLERPGPKLLVQILGVNARTVTAPLATMVEDVLISHPENADETPRLGFPKFKEEVQHGTREPIFTALLSGISPRLYQILLAQVCVSVSSFTAFFYPAEDNTVVSDFAFVMEGLSLRAEAHDQCRQLVRRVLLEDPSFRRVVGQRRDNILPSLSLDQAVAYILDSVRAVPQVNSLPGNSGRSVVLFNIHIASPTKHSDGHKEWIAYLTGKNYCTISVNSSGAGLSEMVQYEHSAFGFGCGSAKRGFMCVKCCGFDHPVGKCPIPALVGKEPGPNDDPNDSLFLLESSFHNQKRSFGPPRGRGGRGYRGGNNKPRFGGYR